MTRRGTLALAAGGVYAALFVSSTGVLAHSASAPTRLPYAHLLLMVAALAAVVATAAAARGSLGTENAFWSLLAVAAAGRVTAETAFLLQATAFPDQPGLLALGHAGESTFHVFAAVAVFVCPHRPLGAARLRAAILEWTMAAVAGYFLLFYLVAPPLGVADHHWSWIVLLQHLVLATGFGVLALSVREAPFATVYRLLAAGLTAAALAGILFGSRGASGRYEPYAANVDVMLTLVALAVAAFGAPRGRAWAPAGDESEPSRGRGWAMAAMVMLPLVVDLASRLGGMDAALAAGRTRVALAVTGVLLTLAAMRVRAAVAAVVAEPSAPASGDSEYVHFATGLAHELNNPLMAVGGWAELALRKTEPRESLEALLAATRRATQSVRRLQQLGQAAEAAAGAASVSPSAEIGGRPASSGIGVTRNLAVATVLFAAVYFTVFRLGYPVWMADALLAVPSAAAALLLWRRGLAEALPRPAAFWRLLALAAGLWTAAQTLWAALEANAIPPHRGGGRPLGVLYIGFLLPVVAALALRPHPRPLRKDPASLPDSVIFAASAAYLFVRLGLASAVTLTEPSATRRILMGALCAAVSVWAAAAWRTVDHPAWRRAYGALALFGLTYGNLRVFANGLDGVELARGGWFDLAWFVPFACLLAATGSGRSGPMDPFPALLAAGVGPIVFDLLLRDVLPATGPIDVASTVCALLLAAAVAVRLRWQVDVDRRARSEARVVAEETRRTGRLTALASLVAASVGELEDQLEDVSRRARASSVIMPDKGEQMLQQARRARDIVRELSHAFRLVPTGPRRDVDLVSLVEETVETALDEGLPLHISLEGLAGLPLVHGDPRALSAALSHLLRNASQATPGGVLRIRGALREGQVELRFMDDGPGVPAALRTEIFDPFFTTRRVGEGVGLGLTLVHFVARGHGGSIVVEDSTGGACFALRLPAGVGVDGGTRSSWPFAGAALAGGVMAILLAVEPIPERRAGISLAFQIATSVAAAVAMGWAAWRQAGTRRVFWTWMAAGSALWALTRLLALADGRLFSAAAPVWPLAVFAAADLSFAAALLFRPDRGHERPSSRLAVLAGAAVVLFAYAQAHLVLLSDAVALADPVLRHHFLLLRGLSKLALPVWAAVLAWRAATPYWRGFYARVSAVLAVWAAGQSIAFARASGGDYAAGGAADLGWIVPCLGLGAFALHEAARGGPGEEPVRSADAARVAGSAPWLIALAGLVAADSLFGAVAGHPALEAARGRLTQTMVVVLALILAGREVLLSREAHRRWQGRFPRDAGPSRWARLVGSAVHELGSHLSSISALARLLLSQADASPRVRADTLRLQERAEAATRVVRNLLAALPSTVGARERLSVNRVVEDALEARRPALAVDGIGLTSSLGRDVPEIPLDAAALRHVVVALLDRAAVAIRAGGAAGTVEVSTCVRGDAVLVIVGDTGAAAGGAVLDRLMDALLDGGEPAADSDLQRSVMRESVERQGGTLAVGHRPGGGTEFVVRLPIPAADLPPAGTGAQSPPVARSG